MAEPTGPKLVAVPSTTDKSPSEADKEPTPFDVEVVYCSPRENAVQRVRVGAGATLQDAIERSHFLSRFPEIDLQRNSFGVYGTITKLSDALSPGDRVEIYRPITCDPETVPRRDREPS